MRSFFQIQTPVPLDLHIAKTMGICYNILNHSAQKGAGVLRLKALELQGFKSFPDKTALTFDQPITAIVGPNGSGKSNLSDAVRWVLGEQSVRTLRGGRMEDVIFGGAQDRPGQGFAQVSLILDGCGELLPGSGDEIAVTRRYYRSGESEYLLNGRQVRLRDVSELFMDTGLGQEGYALIGQGRIDEILSAKSAQRREIFEEAAGISHCRHQKEETQRKLDRTQENLVRIGDKLEELDLQREPLRVQAETAQQYLALKEELRVLEISLWMDQLEQQRGRSARLRADVDVVRTDLENCTRETDEAYAHTEELLTGIRDAEARGERLRADLSQTQEELNQTRRQVALLEARLQNNEENAARLETELEAQAGRQETLDGDLVRQQARLDGLQRQEADCLAGLNRAQARTDEVRGRLTQAGKDWEEALRQGRDRLSRSRRMEKEKEEVWLARRAEEQTLASRHKVWEETTALYEGYNKGVRTAMAEVRRGGLPGVLGPVGELFHVPARYAVAVETALGGAMQDLIVEDEQAGKGVLSFLKRRDGGRVTCRPLTALRPSFLKENGVDQEPGFLAMADSVISCQDRCRSAAQSLLGRTVVVDTLDHAIQMAKRRSYRFPVVTLDGEILRPGGSMTGGSVNRKGGALTRAAEGEALARKLSQARDLLEQARLDREAARAETQAAAEELERLQTIGPQEDPELQARQRELDSETGALREKLAALRAEIRAFVPLLDQIAGQRQTAAADQARRQEQLTAFGRDKALLTEQIEAGRSQLQTLTERERDLNEQVRLCAREKLHLEGERARADRTAREFNERQMRLQREANLLEQRTLQADMEEKRLLDRLWDTYGMTHQGALAVRQPVESVSKANRRAAQLNKAIQDLGTVNLGAVEQYRRVEERYTYLSDQKADIDTARQELEGVLESITAEMEEVFRREFARIQAAFAQTFADLFGGGSGALELEDENDVLGSGIEILAQPPGKNRRALSLLSGGERTLVAIALYFAILRVHPTPFCLADEIEAALDEANGARFIRYLRSVAGSTQFLLITHRRATMEAADVLYGVTMERQGVSRVLKLDLRQAEDLLGKELA